MKPQFYLTFAFLLLTAFAKAQKADTAQAIVHYKFTHLRDTTKRDSPYVENMVLLIGKNASVYKSYDRKLQEERMRKSVQEQISNGTAMGGPIRVSSGGRTMGSSIEYFQFPNESKLVTKERLVNSYLVHETLPVLNWKITSDTASFSGLACQKATTHFKGRDYTAWFCSDLPYRAGPWKLNGLPGLIVEAYDAKKDVVFKFDGIEKIDASAAAAPVASAAMGSGPGTRIVLNGMDDSRSNPNLIVLPANGIKATLKEIADLKELMRKDPQAYMQSQMAVLQAQMGVTLGGGGNVVGTPSFTVQKASASTVVINNPVELAEKK